MKNLLLLAILCIIAPLSSVDATEIPYDDDFRIIIENDVQLQSKFLDAPVDMGQHLKGTGISLFHSMGVRGEGIKIAMIGKKVNFKNPALKDLPLGYKFAGDDRNVAATHINSLWRYQPDNHASEMAGLIAGKLDGLPSIAPNSELFVYNVFGNNLATSTALVLAAVKKAIEKKADIIILPEISILDSKAEALKQAIRTADSKKIVMFAEASYNNYADYSNFAYSGLPVIPVGGYSAPYQLAHWFEDATTHERIRFTSSCLKLDYNLGPREIVVIEPNSWLSANPGRAYEGKVVLVMSPNAEEKLVRHNLKAMNPAGIIMLYETKGMLRDCRIPMFLVGEKEAKYIQKWHRSRRFIFSNQFGNIKAHRPPTVYRPAHLSQLSPSGYPEILMPCTDIFTTTGNSNGYYSLVSHPSLAVAYAAGAAALLRQANTGQKMNSLMAQAAFSKVAIPVNRPGSGALEPVAYQGAGIVDLNRLPHLNNFMVRPLRLELGFGNTATESIFVSSGDKQEVYDVIPMQAAYILTTLTGNVEVLDSTNKVSVSINVSPNQVLQPDGSKKIDIRFTVNTALPYGTSLEYSGYLMVSPRSARQSLHPVQYISVPYHGRIM